MFGRIGAKFALSPGGPYQSFLLTKDIKQFVEFGLPRLWTTYYDAGVVTARLENNIIYVKITGFPIKHEYYEKLLMGYYKQVLNVFGKKSKETMIKSLTAGDEDILLKYELKES
jgi:hypothetical protein